MVAIPFNSIKTIPAVIGITVRSLSFDYLAVIKKMCDLASIGRKDGLFALEKHAREIEDPFFSNYLEQATFERDSKKLKDNMDMEMNNIASRHEAGAELFTFMGTYAPAFGMMGTVMGLIIMMFGFDTGGGGNDAAKIQRSFARNGHSPYYDIIWCSFCKSIFYLLQLNLSEDLLMS